jgi:hypothetical protein
MKRGGQASKNYFVKNVDIVSAPETPVIMCERSELMDCITHNINKWFL